VRISGVSNYRQTNLNLIKRNNKVSFKKLEEKNKEEILKLLPFSEDPKTKAREVLDVILNPGIIIKLGSKDDPRGLLYGEIDESYMEKTNSEYEFNKIRERKSYFLEHLEDKDNLWKLTWMLTDININDCVPGYPIPEETPIEDDDDKPDFWSYALELNMMI